MAFFTYDQNNSGGFYCEPAQHVIVEADDADDAQGQLGEGEWEDESEGELVDWEARGKPELAGGE